MYFWKCWRDSRARLIAYVAVIGLFVLVITVSAEISPDAWTGDRTKGFLYLWGRVLGTSRLLIPFLALGFAASGVGEEFAQRTAEFLLTRPRSRRYFVWMGWAAGAAQLLLLASAYLMVAFIALLYRTKTAFAWEFLSPIVPLFILGVLVYSLTYLMTASLRSGRNGYASGLGIVIFYRTLVWLLQSRWDIHPPSPTDLLVPLSVAVGGAQAGGSGLPFPLVAAVGWTLVALACPLAAQFVVERMEV